MPVKSHPKERLPRLCFMVLYNMEQDSPRLLKT